VQTRSRSSHKKLCTVEHGLAVVYLDGSVLKCAEVCSQCALLLGQGVSLTLKLRHALRTW
jgi:hypothetical protein